MKRDLKKTRYRYLIFIVAGILLGIKYLSPIVLGDKIMGALFGFGISSFVGSMIFPETRKRAFSSSPLKDKIQKTRKSVSTYFTHPTNRPMFYGMLWYLGVAVITIVFFPDFANSTQYSREFMIVITIPTLILVGLTGYRMIKHGEYIGLFYTERDSRAYTTGTLLLLTGWGVALYALF